MFTTLFIALSNPAAAGPFEGRFSIDDDGFVSVRVLVEAPMNVVRGSIDTAQEVFALDSERTLTRVQMRGACEEMHVETPGLLSPMRYVSLRCPTDNGWTESMISSDDFEANEVLWALNEVEGGTEITYKVKVGVADMPVPESMLHSRIKRGMTSVMTSLLDSIGDE
jgi:hypothetical protein